MRIVKEEFVNGEKFVWIDMRKEVRKFLKKNDKLLRALS